MSKRSKIKISSPPSNEIFITPTTVNKKIIFSFEYYDENESDFNMKQISNNKDVIKLYESLLNAMKDYSQIDNFRKKIHDERAYRASKHIHSIDWKN